MILDTSVCITAPADPDALLPLPPPVAAAGAFPVVGALIPIENVAELALCGTDVAAAEPAADSGTPEEIPVAALLGKGNEDAVAVAVDETPGKPGTDGGG